jgi:hypothetical protein
MGDAHAIAVSHSVNDSGGDVTVLVNDDLADAAAPVPHRRRSWPWVIALVVVLALVATGTSAVVYAHTYSPLGPGNYGGGWRGHLRAVTDGVDDPTRYIMTGPAGSTGRVEYSVENDGRYSVRILGADIEPDSGLNGMLSVSWSRTTPGGNGAVIGGLFKDARPFPVTLRPHDEITLWVIITKPRCGSGEVREMDSIPLRTEALRVHHEWDFPLALGGFSSDIPIDVCSPKQALAHISKF